MKSFNVTEFKAQFPLFAHPENKNLVYLDNAATTQKPAAVIHAYSDFYGRINANANRASHRLARNATEMIKRTRNKTAAFIGARNSEQIVFTSGATLAINILAHHCARVLKPGDEIVISVQEHHANIVPWQEAAQKSGASLRVIDIHQPDWPAQIHDRCKMLSISAASNTLGQRSDLTAITALKHRYPDLWINLDASQRVAHQPLDIEQLACDFCVFSTHKCYGPSGLGVLYGKQALLDQLSPMVTGGEMITQVTIDNSDYARAPARLEAGTAPLAALAAWEACLDFWQQQDRQGMQAHENRLNKELHRKLAQLFKGYPQCRLLTEVENNVGIASIAMPEHSVADLAYWLDEQDIAVRAGDHCAQPLWRSMGVGKALRISLAAYNTEADIARLLQAFKGFLQSLSEPEIVQQAVSELSSVQWHQKLDELLAARHWQRRFKLITQWAKSYQPPENLRCENNSINGCESQLWLGISEVDQRFYFDVDSDSAVVKGLAMVVVSPMQGLEAKDVLALNLESTLATLGFEKHLSESRMSGLGSLLKAIHSRLANQ